MTDAPWPDIIEHVSPLSFDATLERLLAAIAGAGLILFHRMDHHIGAREAGWQMPPTVVLSYGHPKGGTPVMLACPLAALDLPLRVLIRLREDGQTSIAFHPMGDVLRRAGVPAALATKLDPAQQMLLKALTP